MNLWSISGGYVKTQNGNQHPAAEFKNRCRTIIYKSGTWRNIRKTVDRALDDLVYGEIDEIHIMREGQ